MCYNIINANRTVMRGWNILKRIFIVDDDVYIGDMLEEILTKEGYSVSRAYSGTEAGINPISFFLT